MTVEEDDQQDEYTMRRPPSIRSTGRNKFAVDMINTIAARSAQLALAHHQKAPQRRSVRFEERKSEDEGDEDHHRVHSGSRILGDISFFLILLLFFFSCLIRYCLEHLTNLMLSSFKEQIQWDKYWSDSGCNGEAGKEKFICKAYQICIQEVIPQFFPTTPDDIWIKVLLIIVCLLFLDKIDLEVKLKQK